MAHNGIKFLNKTSIIMALSLIIIAEFTDAMKGEAIM